VALAVLSLHGASYVALKTDGALHERARRWARRLLPTSAALVLAFVAASFVVRPDFTANFARWPWLVLFPVAAAGAFVAAFVLQRRPGDLAPFLATGALVALLLASAAAGLYPLLLPAGAGSAHPGLDIHNAASPEGSLRIALAVYLAGMAIVIAYTVNVYRVWRGKVSGPVYH
jgi:cytochrome d ubiquinol oxidase subunit II